MEEIDMEFGFTAEEESFRKEVCEFLDREVTDEVLNESLSRQGPGPHSRELLRKLGEKRWLCITWPEEYGGMNGTPVQRLILHDEMRYRLLYFSMVGGGMAGPTIMIHGSDELKKEYLPRIASGEIEFALGYTEPAAGSDLAALEIKAEDAGDEFILNGQKIFNTDAHFAEYHWLGARTDLDAPKHKGVSLMIVDLSSPGISIGPLHCLDGLRTNIVYYDDVRVPKRNLVGELNKGFYHIMDALAFERVFPIGEVRRLLDELVAYVKETKRNGKPLSQDPLVRQRIANAAAEIEVGNLLAYKVAWLIGKEIVPDYQAAMLKMYVTETRQRFADAAIQILKDYSQLTKDSKWAQFHGHMIGLYSEGFRGKIVGGTSEVQRIVISNRGLKMPRA
jgi:alkylation response protein AidB-like acyl-CoA dehydrogenase